jgi:hypothetical protein
MGILVLAGFSIYAQNTPDDEPLEIGESRVVVLSGNEPAQLNYTASSGEVITITVRSLSGGEEFEEGTIERTAARDTAVDVLGPDGRRIAYNHNHGSEREDLAPNDSVISHLRLNQAGTYTIRVNTYGGIFNSEVEVILEAADLFEATFSENEDGSLVITGTLPPFERYTYTFEAFSGEILTITARDTSHSLDPVLALVDPAGVVIAFNDDHGSPDTRLNVLDARLSSVVIPEGGLYTIILTDFLGSAGTFEIMIARR